MAKKDKKRSKFGGKVGKNAKDQKEQKESGFGYLNLTKGLELLKLGDKKHIFSDYLTGDILPYYVEDKRHLDRDNDLEIALPGELWYKKPFYIHRGVGVDNETVVCPSTYGKKCPICEYRAARIADGASWQDPDVQAANKSLRNLYYLIPRNFTDFKGKKLEEKAFVWDISQFCFQDQLNEDVSDARYGPDRENFPDLEDGLTLNIRFKEVSKGGFNFSQASRIDFTEREIELSEDDIKNLPSLDSLLIVYDYEKIKNMFQEIDDDEENENRTNRTEPDDDEGNEPNPNEDVDNDPDPEPIDEEDSEEDDGLDDMDLKDLKKLAKSEGLKVYKGDKEEKLIDRIRESREQSEPEPEEEEEPHFEEDTEPEEEPKPIGKSDKKKHGKSTSASKSGDKCPYGHEFGVDTDDYPECDPCKLWEECIDKKEG